MSEENLPETISFTNDDEDAIGRRPKPKEGVFMRQRVTAAERTQSEEKVHLMLALTMSPVNGSGNAVKAIKARQTLIIPSRNLDWEKRTGKEHKFVGKDGATYDPFDNVYRTLASLNPELPRFAKYDKDLKTTGAPYVKADGTTLTKEENDEDRRIVTRAYLAAIKAAWADPESLVSLECYGKLAVNGNFTNIESLTSREPDEEVITEGFFAVEESAVAA